MREISFLFFWRCKLNEIICMIKKIYVCDFLFSRFDVKLLNCGIKYSLFKKFIVNCFLVLDYCDVGDSFFVGG